MDKILLSIADQFVSETCHSSCLRQLAMKKNSTLLERLQYKAKEGEVTEYLNRLCILLK